MLSKRLLAVADLVKVNSKVLDIGTDHAYLPIYLREMNICKSVIASDVSASALAGAKKNLEKFQTTGVKLILSDGLAKITDDYDTITISGMGTKNIIDILEGRKLPSHIILSSNNNLYELRLYMNKLGYKIIKEVACFDKGKWYDIISYEKGLEKLSKTKLLYGTSHDKKYFAYLFQKEKKIYKEMNLKNKLKLIPNLMKLKIISM